MLRSKRQPIPCGGEAQPLEGTSTARRARGETVGNGRPGNESPSTRGAFA